MVKIEQLKAAKAVFTRNGVEQPVFLGSILTRTELDSLRVLEGTVVVSIDESEVVTITVTDTPTTKTVEVTDTVVILPEVVETELKSPEPSEPTVEAPVAETKVIVQPKAKQAK